MQELQQLLGWSAFSVTRAGKRHEGQLIQSRDAAETSIYGRGIEPGNGAELSLREMVPLMDPHNKITKGTNTHTPPRSELPDQTVPGTSERLCSASSSWAEHTRPRKRVRNRTFILCLLWSFFWKSWGCPRGWRGSELCHILYDRYVGMLHHGPMVVSPKRKVVQKSSSLSCLAGMNFYGILSL